MSKLKLFIKIANKQDLMQAYSVILSQDESEPINPEAGAVIADYLLEEKSTGSYDTDEEEYGGLSFDESQVIRYLSGREENPINVGAFKYYNTNGHSIKFLDTEKNIMYNFYAIEMPGGVWYADVGIGHNMPKLFELIGVYETEEEAKYASVELANALGLQNVDGDWK
jgi:hypothetical protein